MESIIDISNGIKEPTFGYQNCNTSQVLVFDGYVKVRTSLYTQVNVWVNVILNHIGTRVNRGPIHLGMKVLAWCIDPNSIENKKIFKQSKIVKSSL